MGIRIIVISLVLGWVCPSSEADLIHFDFGTGSVIGPVLTQTLTAQTVGGVTFDVTLTVTASHDIKLTAGALGVSSESNGPNQAFVNDGESIDSFVVSFANETGGSMQFGDTVADGTIVLTGSPIAWSTTAGTGGQFKLSDIGGNFSAAAVPEPSSFVLFGVVALVGFGRRRPASDRWALGIS